MILAGKMILTAKKIAEERRDGEIILEPFDDAAMNPNTYNLHLSSRVLAATDVGWNRLEIPADGLDLEPAQLYLASTVERFGSRCFVPMLSGRSSVGRLGLFVHLAADMGNLGAVHSWTLELFASLPVRVYAGMPIVQVSFWRAEGEITPYAGCYDSHDEATPSLSRRLQAELTP